MNMNNPSLKLRYSIGLGDIIACLLHSRPFGWITKIITGKDKPCSQCSQRRQALNILFPIPFWKLFFEDQITLLETIAAEYRALGYNTRIDEKAGRISLSKFTQVPDAKKIIWK